MPDQRLPLYCREAFFLLLTHITDFEHSLQHRCDTVVTSLVPAHVLLEGFGGGFGKKLVAIDSLLDWQELRRSRYSPLESPVASFGHRLLAVMLDPASLAQTVAEWETVDYCPVPQQESLHQEPPEVMWVLHLSLIELPQAEWLPVELFQSELLLVG